MVKASCGGRHQTCGVSCHQVEEGVQLVIVWGGGLAFGTAGTVDRSWQSECNEASATAVGLRTCTSKSEAIVLCCKKFECPLQVRNEKYLGVLFTE